MICDARCMNDPFEMASDETIDLELPQGVVRLHRGPRSWLFQKQQEPTWWRRLAVATHSPAEANAWELQPTSPFFDEESYDSWAQVLNAVDRLDLPPSS